MDDEQKEKNEQSPSDIQIPKKGRRPKNQTHTLSNDHIQIDTNLENNTEEQKENLNKQKDIEIDPIIKRRKVSLRILPRKEESEDRDRKVKHIKPKKIKLKIEEPKKLVSHKDKVLHFLNKDQFQVLYPEIRPFKNKKHAIECLLPYHLFNEYTDDDVIEYDSGIDLNKLMERTKNAFIKASESDSIVIDILRLEETKYMLERMKMQKECAKNSVGKLRMKIYNKNSIKIRMPVDEEFLNNDTSNKL